LFCAATVAAAAAFMQRRMLKLKAKFESS